MYVLIANVRNMLVQSPARGDIQDLQAPADAQQRLFPLDQQVPDQAQFTLIAFRIDRQDMGVPAVAVIVVRINIGATRHHQAIQQRQDMLPSFARRD